MRISDWSSDVCSSDLLATRDALSQLPNKSLFLEQLGFALRDARPGRLGILYVNVNRMKGFNDALGIAGGDELLRQIGERLRSQLSGRSFIAKFSGDTFRSEERRVGKECVSTGRSQW